MNKSAECESPAFHRLLRRGLLLLAGLYLFICAACAAFQRSLLYYPTILSSDQVDRLAAAAALERWTDSNGRFIGLKRLSPDQPAAGSILLMYGNGSTAVNAGRQYADDIQRAARFDVFILEYPGYEDRPGSPSQTSLFRAARQAFQQLPGNRPIYLVGESLGSGVASYLAGIYSNKISGVIFISPFNSVTDVAQNHFPLLPVRWLLVDRFSSESYLRNYHGRLGVTVDGNDTVVPQKFGRRLYAGYRGPKKLWEFPGGGHCQIMEPRAQFWKEVIEFWRSDASG